MTKATQQRQDLITQACRTVMAKGGYIQQALYLLGYFQAANPKLQVAEGELATDFRTALDVVRSEYRKLIENTQQSV